MAFALQARLWGSIWVSLSNRKSDADRQFEAILRRQQRMWRRRLLRVLMVGAVIGFCFAGVGLLDGPRMLQGMPAIATLLQDMWPPDFSRWPQWLIPLGDTLAMSIAGSAIAIILSLPISILAARNTSPHPICFWIARGMLNGARAIPELILGMILVAAVGFGKLPGTLALGLHSVGMVGKFFAEAIELSHPAPVEAARATGATEAQIIVHSIFPQVLPKFADVSFYRWEYNLRASLVLGAVGAGGMGAEIIGALRILKYQQVAAQLIVVLLMVTLVDSLSSLLRQRFID